MKPQDVFELVVLHINQWSERKKYLFNNEDYVRLVLNHLYKFEKLKNGLLYVWKEYVHTWASCVTLSASYI